MLVVHMLDRPVRILHSWPVSRKLLSSPPLSLHFNGHSPGEPGLAGVHWSKGGWKWMVTAGAIGRAKLQSNHYYQQTNTKFFLEAGCPSCRPTNNVNIIVPARATRWWESLPVALLQQLHIKTIVAYDLYHNLII